MVLNARPLIIAAMPLMLILCGCETGYQQMNIWDGLGYTDEKIGDGVYRLTYLVNAVTPPEVAMKHWHARARELCGSSRYDHTANLTMQNHPDYNPTLHSSQNHRFPYVEGTVRCKKS
jgi:hypothetical protein